MFKGLKGLLFGTPASEEFENFNHLPIEELERINTARRQEMVESEILPPPRPQLREVGASGLINLGNTCFMNASLQCLMHVRELNRYILDRRWLSKINTVNYSCKGRLVYHYLFLLDKALCDANDTSAPLNPENIKAVIEKHCRVFAGYAQQDAQEFLSFFIDALHEDLNEVLRKPYCEIKDTQSADFRLVAQEAWKLHQIRNKSIVVDLFFGQFFTCITCPTCSKVSHTFDPFDVISLNVPWTTEFEAYHIPLSSTCPTMRKFCQATSTTTCREMLEKLFGTMLAEEETIIVPCFRHNSIIDTNELSLDESVDNLMQNRSYLFLDEIYNKKVYGIVFSERCDSVVEEYREKRSNFLLFSVFLGSCVKSVQRRILLPAAFSFKDIYFLVHLIYRKALSSCQSSSMEVLKSDEPDSHELLSKEVSCLWPNGKYDPLTSPFYITVNDEKIESPEEDVDVSQSFASKTAEIKVYLNAEIIEDIKLKTVSNEKVDDAFKPTTLQACFQEFIKSEVLDNENQWYCKECKSHKNAVKQMLLFKLPKYLIVHLKRFQRSARSKGSYKKNGVFIDFPLESLSLREFSHSECAATSRYDLISVCNHYGDLGGGHYTSFCVDNGVWYKFNDSKVSKVSSEDVVTSSAYILFYEAKLV